MADRISFPYERTLTPIGFVWVPTARVRVVHRGIRLDLDMIVDTGVDVLDRLSVLFDHRRRRVTFRD